MKYRCLQCEDPCVLEIAMEADYPPMRCPFGDLSQWDMWEEEPREVSTEDEDDR